KYAASSKIIYRKDVTLPTFVSRYEPDAGFGTRSNTDFAYQFGLGIACPLNADHDRLSIAYRYINSGNAFFDARNPSENHPYKLEVGKIKTNEIYFSYVHLF
ncbi:MAG: hypothetical protein WCH10_05295, partial [bacterium]